MWLYIKAMEFKTTDNPTERWTTCLQDDSKENIKTNNNLYQYTAIPNTVFLEDVYMGFTPSLLVVAVYRLILPIFFWVVLSASG